VSNEEKYIVRNKDTGEVYDIRTLLAQGAVEAEAYTVFPGELPPPLTDTAVVDEEVRSFIH
jgi:hypothetical protein